MANRIFFFKEGVEFRLTNQDKLRKWIERLVKKEGSMVSNINYIFCKDSYLRKMNTKYLSHDYNTDIITFNNSNTEDAIEGDIFISIDRVKANSSSYKTTFNDELHRVMAHGVLHLLGYRDSNNTEKAEMKKMEDSWISARRF